MQRNDKLNGITRLNRSDVNLVYMSRLSWQKGNHRKIPILRVHISPLHLDRIPSYLQRIHGPNINILYIFPWPLFHPSLPKPLPFPLMELPPPNLKNQIIPS